jgi:nitrogen fixation NifU-like protein
VSGLYGGLILERFRQPRYFGAIPGADAAHEDVNPLCGDRLRVELRLGPGGGLEQVRFQGDACAIATAAADLLAEMVEGRSTADAAAVEREALLHALGAPIRPSRLSCVTLPLAVLRGALGLAPESVGAARRGSNGTRPAGAPRAAGEAGR